MRTLVLKALSLRKSLVRTWMKQCASLEDLSDEFVCLPELIVG